MDEVVNEEIQNLPPVIMLYGEIDDDKVAEASMAIIAAHYDEPERPAKIRIMINSEGGNLHSAFALIEVIKASQIPIETISIGQCVSAGLFIFMSGTPGMRLITESCTVMSHTYSTDIGGNHWDLQAVHKELTNTQDRILRHYMDCTGLTKAKILKELIGKSDVWLTPAEVVKYNMADRVGRLEF